MKTLLGVVGLTLVSLCFGCAGYDTTSEEVATSEGALVSAASAGPACVFGSDSLTIGGRARVSSDLGSNGAVDIQAGTATNKTTVNGNVAARGTVHVGGNSVVGNINTPGAVSVELGATTGTITHNPVALVTLATKTVTPGTVDLNLNAPACTGNSPAPGSYRNFNVNPGCTLNLSAGTYNVASIAISTGAGLNVTGTVILNAKNSFFIGDGVVLNGALDPNTFQIYSGGYATIQTNVVFRGIITAPSGDAVLSSSSSLTGCLRGKRLNIWGGAVQTSAP